VERRFKERKRRQGDRRAYGVRRWRHCFAAVRRGQKGYVAVASGVNH